MTWFQQLFTMTLLTVSTVHQRLGASLAAVIGIAGVVGVFVGVLSIGVGFRSVMMASGREDVAMVLRGGADSETSSNLSAEDARIIKDSPYVQRRDDAALASAELFVIINLPKRSTMTDANVPLRGVQQTVFDVRDNVQILEGRRFEPGKNEVIVGQGAAREFAGLNLNSAFQMGQNTWTVVGIFSSGGGIEDSEIWTDDAILQSAYRRGNSYQSVYAKLRSAADFQAFKDELSQDPRLNVKVLLEPEYYAEQSEGIYQLVTVLGTLIAGLMGVGAVFGALNTMYSAVSTRTREIATLRALGFGRVQVLLTVMLEATALALIGGLIGGLTAWWLFDGLQTSTINWQSFSQVTFAFQVSPDLLVQGAAYALALGLIGGLLPAVRAARLPIANGLREV